jgi:hypothetical protein
MVDIPTADPLDASTPGTLAWAIQAWQRAADDFEQDGNHASARGCRQAVRALEIERDTGVAVCSCCFKPFGLHR